jgi:hypothetical protein|tara:strand:+ start:1135 stop:1422 length:288 start_codon:yes stop_codon:yes gene_type:complete
MSVIIENNFSNHAIKRSQQRGIRPWVVNFILEYSDKYKHANESCISQFISKRKVKKLIQENVLSPAKAALIDGVVVIAKDDTIVTVFHKKIRFRK